MKKVLILSLLFAMVFSATVNAQTGSVPDTRIWSASYWKQMADLGYVPFNPDVVPERPVYLGPARTPALIVGGDGVDVPTADDPNVTQSENSVFIHPLDPTKAFNSNNSTNWPVSTLYGTSNYHTDDGGATWAGDVNLAGAGNNSGDPAAAIDVDGRYYVGFINAGFGQSVAYSDNEGVSWTNVTVVGSGLEDKNHMWVDNWPASPYNGYLYNAWTAFSTSSDIVISRSTNSGTSWSTPVNISSAVAGGSHDQGVNIQTGPNGEVYAVWAVYDSWPAPEIALGFTRSLNGGATYEAGRRIVTNISGIRQLYPGTFPHRVSSFPVMAVDPQGVIYIVWVNKGVPGINTGNDIDVYMVKSTDEGLTWSTPSRVNQDPTGLSERHYYPWITADPVTGGLSVVAYDSRNTTGNAVETWVYTSIDQGNSWEEFRVSDVSFTPAPIPGLAGGYMGDYLGIAARAGTVYPVWTDNRNGIALSYTSPFQLATNVGYVEGIITSDGSPLDGVTIDFLEAGIQLPGNSDGMGYYLAGAEVDTIVGTQDWTLRATKFGFLEYTAPITLILSDTITHNITMATAPGGTLFLHAHTSNGSGIGADVSILLGGVEVVTGSTDPGTGDYTTPLPAGTYDVVVDPPSPYGTETFTDVIILDSQTTNLDALALFVLDPSPTEVHDTLVVGQISAQMLTLTNTTDDDVPFRITDDNAEVRIAITKPAVQPPASPRERQQAPKGASDLRVGPPQYSGAGGPDGFGYRWIDSDEPGGPVFDWFDITGVGTSVTLSDDQNAGPYSLGFDISFYGNTYNSIRICSNGWASFTSTSTAYTNVAIPDAFDPNNALYGFWDDLNPANGGTVHYYADGANNRFIIQFTNVAYFSGTGTVTFQIIVTPDNDVLYQYLTMSGTVTSATIGIENADGSVALQTVFNAAYIHDNLATRFFLPNASWISENPSAGTIPANTSQDITITFDANGLDVGTTYNANLFVSATHPDVEDDIIVPASLTTQLADSAVLLLSKVIVDFPLTPVFDTSSDSVLARNGGAIPLDITSITSSNPEFTVSPSMVRIFPLDSAYIYIDYTPTAGGIDTGRVIILSNSQGTPRSDIILNGEAIGVPSFTVGLDSLQMDIEAGLMDSIQFYMGNDGTQDGDFAARAIMYDPTSSRRMSVPVSIAKATNRIPSYQRGTAAPSAGPAPKRSDATRSGKGARIQDLLRGTGTTAYAVSANLNTFFEELSSFNLDSPGTFNLIANMGDPKYFAGDYGPDGKLYALDYFLNQLVSIDTSSGAVTVIGSSTPFGGETWSGLTYDPSTGTWYAASTDIARSTLFEVDPGTGTTTQIGQMTGSPGCIDIDVDNSGQMYGYDIITDEFYSVNKGTGAVTVIGPIGFDANFAQGMDFDPATNVCYLGAYNNGVGQGELRTVDLDTGGSTLVGAFPNQEVTLLGIPGALGGGAWLAIAPTSGTVAVGDSVLMTARFDATDASIFENPGNYFGEVQVTASNSDLEDTLSIPVRMYVVPPAGARLIATPTALDFGSVQINFSDTVSTLVKNIGLTTLDVTDITTTSGEFTVLAPTSFSLATNDTQRVLVAFNAPSPEGPYSADMNFVSNDPQAPVIPLTAESFGAAVISIDVESLAFNLSSTDTAHATMIVSNTGTGPLDFEINEAFAELNAPDRAAAIARSMEQQPASPVTSKDQQDPTPGEPPVEGTGGPDAFGYIWIDSDEPGGPAFEWDDISSVGTPLTMTDDDNQGPFSLGFDFSFYGNTYSQIRVGSNGFLSFTSTSTTWTNTAIPNALEPNNAIYPFWDDLNPTKGGTIHYYADATNNRFIVQYTDIEHYSLGGETGIYTFQIILTPNGDILVQYLSMVGTITSNTTGIENADGSIALQVVFNASYIHDDLALLFTRDLIPWMSAEPTTGTIAAGDSMAIDVRVHPEGLASGHYEGAFVVSGNATNSVTVPVTLDLVTSVTAEDLVPTVYDLSQNYPNPFNPETRIKYSLPEQATVSLKIYNLLGQEVLSMASGVYEAGYYELTWNGHNNSGSTVGTGIYFYRFDATGVSGKRFTDLKKMVFLK